MIGETRSPLSLKKANNLMGGFMLYVLICTDTCGHCGKDICVLGVSKNKLDLENVIERKKEDESYRFCQFHIFSGVEMYGGSD